MQWLGLSCGHKDLTCFGARVHELFGGNLLLSEGTIVDERYQLLTVLGEGGMGTVYKARELGLERTIALKLLHPYLVGNANDRQRFRREGLLLSRLEHPNILSCYRFGIWSLHDQQSRIFDPNVGERNEDKREVVATQEGANARTWKTVEPADQASVAGNFDPEAYSSKILGDRDAEALEEQGDTVSQSMTRVLPADDGSTKFPYIATEFLKGTTLAHVIHTQGLAVSRLINIAVQICRAMDHAHRHNVVHRDLKPTNIVLLDEPERDFVKIVDFGLARLLPGEGQSGSQHLTQTGLLVGSAYYMSPEQCLGRQVDGRADIYALGCVLYEGLTGAPPLVSDNSIGLMHMHVNQKPAPLSGSACAQEIPAGLEAVVMKALAKSPDDRYQSMDQMQHDLELVLEGRGDTLCGADGISSNQRRPVDSPRKTRAIIIGSVIALICFVAVFTKFKQEPSPVKTMPVLSANLGSSFPYQRERMTTKERVAYLRAWAQKYGAGSGVNAVLVHFFLYREMCYGPDPEFAFLMVQKPYQDTKFTYGNDAEVEHERNEFLQRTHQLIQSNGNGRWTNDELSQAVLRSLEVRFETASETEKKELAIAALEHYGDRLRKSTMVDIQRLIADIYERAGDYAAEEALRRKTMKFLYGPDRILLARCLYRRNQVAEAESIMSTITVDRPHLDQELAAIVLLEQHQPKRAAETLLADKGWALDAARKAVAFNYLLATAYTQDHRYGEARELLLSGLKHGRRLEKLRLLPALVRNCAAQKVDVNNILAEYLRNPTSADEEWVLNLARECRYVNGALSNRLALQALHLIEPELETKPQLVADAAVLAGVFNDLGDNRQAKELATKALRGIAPGEHSRDPSSHLKSPKAFSQSKLRLQLELTRALTGLREFSAAGAVVEDALKVARSQGQLKRSVVPLVDLLCQQGNLALAENNLSLADAAFQEAYRFSSSLDVNSERKAHILEGYAAVCKAAGHVEESKALLAAADRAWPACCRVDWRYWSVPDETMSF